jgi:hypothetical protein
VSQSKREEIEARRAARQKAHEAAREAQELADLEALDVLEEVHGYGRVLRIELDGWTAGSGAATIAVARIPLSSEVVFKKFVQQAHSKDPKPAQSVAAETELGEACLAYPSRKEHPEIYAATMEMFPGLLGHVAAQVAKAAQGRAAEEGK